MRIVKNALMATLITAIITAYTIREFNPQQPLHHELNAAAGVLLLALVLVWWFFPLDDEDDE